MIFAVFSFHYRESRPPSISCTIPPAVSDDTPLVLPGLSFVLLGLQDRTH